MKRVYDEKLTSEVLCFAIGGASFVAGCAGGGRGGGGGGGSGGEDILDKVYKECDSKSRFVRHTNNQCDGK